MLRKDCITVCVENLPRSQSGNSHQWHYVLAYIIHLGYHSLQHLIEIISTHEWFRHACLYWHNFKAGQTGRTRCLP